MSATYQLGKSMKETAGRAAALAGIIAVAGAIGTPGIPDGEVAGAALAAAAGVTYLAGDILEAIAE